MDIKKKLKSTLIGLKENLPFILGILLLISILKFSPIFDILQKIPNNAFGAFIADVLGSISASNPINSYIIADGLNLQQKILVLTAFLIAWITVGLVQLPAESYFFGKKFAIVRNIVSFVFAFVAAWVVYLIIKIVC